MASGWRPSLAEIGGAPSDGDFARLLEAASEPGAHRMAMDPAVTRFGGRTGRQGAGAPLGPPGMVRESAAPRRVSHAQTDAPAGALSGGPSPRSGRSGDSAGTPVGAALEPLAGAVASGAGLVSAWRRRPLRDRLVFALLALAVLWMLVAIVGAVLDAPGADVGPLVLLAVIAFFLLRARARRRSSDPS